jgi:pimeloyl-ACP methyl ester carboxylesterase
MHQWDAAGGRHPRQASSGQRGGAVSVLPWRRHGPPEDADGSRGDGAGGATGHAPTVLALHAWGSTAKGDFAGTGFAAGLAERGVATLACDLPGHGGAVEVAAPDDAEPAAWTASLIAAEPAAWMPWPVVVLGHRDGALPAAHLAVRGELDVAALVLVGCEGDRALPLPASAAEQIADHTATVWDPAVSSVVAGLRRVAHDPATLAAWLARAAWPAMPRLGAVRIPVRVVAEAGRGRQRAGAPRWAAPFGDASVATVGSTRHVLGAPGLHAAVAELAGVDRQAAGDARGG